MSSVQGGSLWAHLPFSTIHFRWLERSAAGFVLRWRSVDILNLTNVACYGLASAQSIKGVVVGALAENKMCHEGRWSRKTLHEYISLKCVPILLDALAP